ncbi:MAG TPA: hypothetical protein VNR39_06105 [Pseudolabrys sp.]|nr:hypothetical protein [Pseudolabrys sp.]
MSMVLRDGIGRLETTSRVTLAILSLASGVYTYLGVRDLLNGDATIVFFAAVIYSAAVSVGIYAFWLFLMRFLPHIRERSNRALLFGCMGLGAVMIVAMSSWLNASALAGAAAIQQHLAVMTQGYTRDLDRAHNNALAAQGLLPDIQMASTRFSRLADAERSGSLTGTAGSGTVVQLLTQMANQLDNLGKEVAGSADKVTALYAQGGKHLEKMRELVSDRGPINARSDAFGKEAMNLMGVIAKLQQTSVAPSVKRAADGLIAGFIAPAAGGRGDLAERQTSVVGKVEQAVDAQAKALSGAAEKILDTPAVEPQRFQSLSTAEAVVRYAGDFLPSWAGAISIDLLPAVLVLILCVVEGSIRGSDEPIAADSMTAGQMLAALRLARDIERTHAELNAASDLPKRAAEADAPLQPAAAPDDENVTALATARAGKKGEA